MSKYLSHNKIYQKREPNRDAKKIYIFTEGQVTEVEYFKYFKNLSSNIDIITVPNEKGQSDPEKLKNNAEILFCGSGDVLKKYELNYEYKDEVWFVIDTDRWNEKGKIDILKNYVDEKNKSYTGWFVVQSNPSFEIWLYYHSYTDKPREEEVDSFISFKAFIDNKIKGGFDNRKMPLDIQFAISNAEANYEDRDGQPQLFSTEVYKLGAKIINFIKPVIDECLRKYNVIHR